MRFHPARDLSTPLRAIARANRDDPETAFTESVDFLRALLKHPLQDDDLQLVYAELAFVQYRFGRASEAEPVVLAATARFPRSPLPWIAASSHYGFWSPPPRDLGKAKQMAWRAVEVAQASGSFVIHSLNELCRTAKAAEDYRMLEQGIRSLLDHSPVLGTIDSAYECDFLLDLPEGAVDEDLIRCLREHCRKSPH